MASITTHDITDIGAYECFESASQYISVPSSRILSRNSKQNIMWIMASITTHGAKMANSELNLGSGGITERCGNHPGKTISRIISGFNKMLPYRTDNLQASRKGDISNNNCRMRHCITRRYPGTKSQQVRHKRKKTRPMHNLAHPIYIDIFQYNRAFPEKAGRTDVIPSLCILHTGPITMSDIFGLSHNFVQDDYFDYEDQDYQAGSPHQNFDVIKNTDIESEVRFL
ncbi:penicillin-binding protein 2 [Sesbania bispinosa]|nr:penicillin-binding protein 2 [Sesbania bispinosa]